MATISLDEMRLREQQQELIAVVVAFVEAFNLPPNGKEDHTIEPYFQGPLRKARAVLKKHRVKVRAFYKPK